MPPDPDPILVVGRLLTDPARAPEPGWLVIHGEQIQEIGFGDPPRDAMPPDHGGPDSIICPGFIDAHFHFPQIDSVGCDGLELLEWLDRVIYPAEAWWGKGYALPSARLAVRRMLSQGTLGVAGYLTSHAQPASEVLELLATQTPMRFVVGRVAMDREATDELTREDRERARRAPPPAPALSPVDDDPRHQVSANPRFAIACSEELLAEIGWHLRSHPELYVQTHLAESRPECTRIKELFPDDPDYTSVYDRFGLLTERMILAHCIYLSESEWELIAQRQCVVAHCPGANLFLGSGLFDLDAARDHGVRLALGSDVAAGPDVAMPRVARAMIETAKIRAMSAPSQVHIPAPAEAWRQITAGNAEALGWTGAGVLEVGAPADVLVLRPPQTWLDEHLVGRLIYGWSSKLIDQRICNGYSISPDTIFTKKAPA